MFELIKDIGSFVGLITGIFVFLDRFSKGRPLASLTISQEDGRPSPRIRIANVSQYDVSVEEVTGLKVYMLAEEEGPEGNLRASYGVKPTFMLKPDESRELRLVPRFEGGIPIEAMGNKSVTFFIWWRRGNMTWLPQLPIIVRTSTIYIRKYGLEKPDIPI